MTYHRPISKSADGYYGESYQLNMANKYKNRDKNHRKSRIDLAHRLVNEYALSRLENKPSKDVTFLDIGCAIGTFPIEFAKRGFDAYGVDFSKPGIEMAKKLAAEEGVKAEFIVGDVTDLDSNLPKMDIVGCFDIFEHLHDDEIGALLKTLKPRMAENGAIIFHTYPTQYDYIFYGKTFMWLPLAPFALLPKLTFEKFVKMYASFIDILKILVIGSTQREIIKNEAHCNTLTEERLADIFNRAGYDILHIETSNLIAYNRAADKIFRNQPITYRDIQGVAIPR